MALIPQKPRQQVALLVIALSLGGGYAFHEYWYASHHADVVEMEARLGQLEGQNRRAQLVATRGMKDLEQRLALYERHVSMLEQLIPASEEVPALLNSMALEARRSDVDLALMRPEPAQPGTFYTKQSYEIGVVGEYHDVGRFLTSVASLSRIVTPVDMDMMGFEGQRDALDPELDAPVTARFRIQTYVLPGSAGPDAADLESGENAG